MFLGRVAGTVWSTVKWPEAQGLKLLLVRPYRARRSAAGRAAAGDGGGAPSEPTDDLVVCADMLDAGPGDDVIVAFGHAARVALSEKLPPGEQADGPDRRGGGGGRRSRGDRAAEGRRPAPPRRRGDARGDRAGRAAAAGRRAAGEARRGGGSRAVVTTTGKNQRGIVAKIAQAIADAGGDIVDISQTLVSDYFTMIIVVDAAALSVRSPNSRPGSSGRWPRLGAECLVMHEDVVNALQRV